MCLWKRKGTNSIEKRVRVVTESIEVLRKKAGKIWIFVNGLQEVNDEDH